MDLPFLRRRSANSTKGKAKVLRESSASRSEGPECPEADHPLRNDCFGDLWLVPIEVDNDSTIVKEVRNIVDWASSVGHLQEPVQSLIAPMNLRHPGKDSPEIVSGFRVQILAPIMIASLNQPVAI
jgi:hypothetical protein